jgi:hypothetical protein
MKLYERDNYAEFVKSDVLAMLDEAGIVPVTDRASARR